MSNLEKHPDELILDESSAAAIGTVTSGVQILEAREVPLGGPRAMKVHRTLPQRGRPTIGAWCFADHYGPGDSDSMVVPPHPHTGLQTASWLFGGEIEHRDSVGTLGRIHPGELNLMTAGRGISHSEVSFGDATRLHGVQLWIVLPDHVRHGEPFFERHTAVTTTVADAALQVFVGAIAGVSTDASVFTPLLGAQLDLPPFGRAELPLDTAFEHGLLVDVGPLTVDGVDVARTELAFLTPGRESVTVTAGEAGARALLLGGEPFGERFIMWWNFIGRTHDEIEQFRSDWQTDAITHRDPGGRFGIVDYDGRALPAPEMPTVRLKPRS
ncbi:pirin [Leifsonia sp. Leaf325]|nr:pirin family protein [Leifsonia sp. Leaf325]KQQ93941.1 pirin [Leifsonia sp. Leaf325]